MAVGQQVLSGYLCAVWRSASFLRRCAAHCPSCPYKDYTSLGKSTLSDTEKGISLIGEKEFEDYINTENNDSCLEIDDKRIVRITDEKAKKIIHKKTKCDSIAEFQQVPKAKRDKLLRVLKDQGLSIRQISRLTGTPKGVVERAVKVTF